MHIDVWDADSLMLLIDASKTFNLSFCIPIPLFYTFNPTPYSARFRTQPAKFSLLAHYFNHTQAIIIKIFIIPTYCAIMIIHVIVLGLFFASLNFPINYSQRASTSLKDPFLFAIFIRVSNIVIL